MRTRIQRAATIALIGTILLMWIILLGGCSRVAYQDPSGARLEWDRWLWQTSVREVSIEHPDGTKIRIDGYGGRVDADAVGAAVAAALKAMAVSGQRSEIRGQADHGRVARATFATDNGQRTTDSHRRGAP